MKRVFFVSYGGGHINALLPVIEQLEKSHDHEVVVLALTTAHDACVRRNVRHVRIKDFRHLLDAAALAHGERLVDQLGHQAVDREESVAYLGGGYWDMVKQAGEAQAQALYAERGRQAFLPIDMMGRILDSIEPDVVIATSSPRAERAMICAARARGIPSLCVVDLYPAAELSWLGEADYANCICVIDRTVREHLIALGRKPEEIVVTGNPTFDKHILVDQHAVADAYRSANHVGDRKLVLYAPNVEPGIRREDGSQTHPDLPKVLFEKLYAECLREGHQLIVRQHPSETPWHLPANVLNGRAADLEVVLAASDALVTFPSTIVLEARYYGLPTIVPGMSALVCNAPYLAQGDILMLDDLDALGFVLQAALARGKTRQNQYVSRATELVVRQIESLLID